MNLGWQLTSAEAPLGSDSTARRWRWLLVFLLGALSACADDIEPAPVRNSITLTDANNYRVESSLEIPSVDVAADVDLEICWSELTHDLQCHELTPTTEVNNLSLLRFAGLSEADVEDKLTFQLSMSDVNGYLEYNTLPGETCAHLSQLDFFGTPVEIEQEFRESDDNIYMLVFTEGTLAGVGARSMTFVRPLSSATATRVDAPPGCGMLDFSADLVSLEPVSVPRAGPLAVDWRDITRDGGGHPVPFASIDSVLVAFYAERSVSEIQDAIFDLEELATEIWELKVSGERSADLAQAVSRKTGNVFQGFDRDETGAWFLALMCSTCSNPAPVMLTVLEPEAH